MGKIDLRDGMAEPAIYPPYATTALIPTICCKRARCKAMKTAILLFLPFLGTKGYVYSADLASF
jgi:hypothetical protein